MSYLPVFCLGVIASLFVPLLFAHSTIFLITVGLVILLFSFFYPKLWWLFFLYLGVMYGFCRLQWQLIKRVDDSAHDLTNIYLHIEVQGEVAHYRHYYRFRARVLDPHIPFKLLIIKDYFKREWPSGSRWQVQANVKSTIGQVNEVGFHSEAWALSQGIDGSATLKKQRKALFIPSLPKVSSYLYQRILTYQSVYPAGSALVASLALGNRQSLSASHWDDFKRLGLSHLISVSGLHVGIIVLLIECLLLWLLRSALVIFPWPWPLENPFNYLIATGLIAAVFYSALTGFSVPAQRSVLMLAVLSGTIFLRCYYSKWQIWWLALLVVLLLNPMSALNVGFWLSFLSVASLLLIPIGTREEKRRFHHYAVSLIQAQLAVTLVSSVLAAVLFNQIPVGGLLANLVAIPWFSFVLTPFALLSVIIPIAAPLELVVFLSEKTLQLMHIFSSYFPLYPVAHLPFTFIGLLAFALVLIILPTGTGLKPWAVIMLLALWCYQPKAVARQEAVLTVFDVGQGLSILIQTHSHAMLYDTGERSFYRDLQQNLLALGVRKLSLLMLSHHDQDHDGNWLNISRYWQVDKILAGQAQAYVVQHNIPVVSCRAGQNWNWDGVHFELLTLPADHYTSDNDRSCILRIIAAGKAILLVGDLSSKGETKLVKQYANALDAHILVLGHHGSFSSSSSVFLDHVNPQVAIASSGYNNRFHHPDKRLLAALKKRGIQVFRTDRQGAIKIKLQNQMHIYPVVNNVPSWQRKPWKD